MAWDVVSDTVMSRIASTSQLVAFSFVPRITPEHAQDLLQKKQKAHSDISTHYNWARKMKTGF